MLDASGIRQEDIDEWVGGVGGPVLPALLAALDIPGSQNAAFLRDGVVLCLWGTHAAPIGVEGIGIIWFIAGKVALRHVLDIHRHFAPVLKEMHSRFPVLVACTHPRNTAHHVWMERNGFELVPGRTLTEAGIPYLTYRRTA